MTISALSSTPAIADPVTQLEETAKQFESLFVGIMLKAMRASIPQSELGHGGHAEDIYTSLLDDEYANIMAGQGQSGLARLIADQMRGHLKLPDANKLRELQGELAYERASTLQREAL